MSEFSSILVVCTQQIGDVLLTTPLIHAAKQRWPRARIDVLGFEGTLDILRGNPDIDELLAVRRGGGLREKLALLGRLWRRYDLALVTRGGDRAHVYGWLAARVRCGIVPLHASGRRLKRALLAHIVDEAPDSHNVLEKLQLLAPWVDTASLAVQLVPPPATALPPDVEGVLQPRPVVVHVPSLRRYKQWPIAHYQALVRGLVARGYQVALTGSGSGQDRELVAQVARAVEGDAAPRVLDLAGRLDFNQLAGLLGRCALYIGPDAAITHLAAACKAPSIALFGPTPPVTWGPWPAGHPMVQPWQRRGARQPRPPILLLQGPGSCVPCGREGCEDHQDSRSDCLIGLQPALVLDEALTLLQAAGPVHA
jgi:heptosyltransferase-3